MNSPRLISLFALCAFSCLVHAADQPRPNLIFILADDLRWDALGCMGNPRVQTPHIDRLANEGVRFTQHFVTTSICSVSRASIFTGQHARRHGIVEFDKPFTPGQWALTYPALLRQAGYRTGFIGKWGVGEQPAQVAAMAGHFDFFKGKPGQAGALFIQPDDPSRTHTTARMGSEALEFLAGSRRDQPFCLSISFNAPHARDGKPREFQPDDRDEPLYADLEFPVPRTATDGFFQLLPPSVKSRSAARAGRCVSTRRRNTRAPFGTTTGLSLALTAKSDASAMRCLSAASRTTPSSSSLRTMDSSLASAVWRTNGISTRNPSAFRWSSMIPGCLLSAAERIVPR